MRPLRIAVLVLFIMLVTVGPQILLGVFLPTTDPLERVMRLLGGMGWGYLVGQWVAAYLVRRMKQANRL